MTIRRRNGKAGAMRFPRPNRLLVSGCVALCLSGFAAASDLIEVLPLTHNIIMLHFDDGHLIHHQRGQSRSDEKVLTDPLDTAAASSAQTYTIASQEDTNYAQSQHPVQVGRKSKGTDFAWFVDKWENGHAVNS